LVTTILLLFLLLLLFLFLFLLSSLLSSSSPYVVQAGFKLSILLPQPPVSWVCQHVPASVLSSAFFLYEFDYSRYLM
jgi:hypothetical protein